MILVDRAHDYRGQGSYAHSHSKTEDDKCGEKCAPVAAAGRWHSKKKKACSREDWPDDERQPCAIAVVTASGMAVYSQGLQNFLATGSHVADESSLDGRLAQILTPGESTPRACTINFSGFPVTRSIPGALDCRRGPRHRKWLVGRARSPMEGSPP